MSGLRIGPQADEPAPDLHLGVLGVGASGKTTYLAALGVAWQWWPEEWGAWQILAEDDDSEAFLVGDENPLLKGRFPQGTNTPQRYRWVMSAELRGPMAGAWPELFLIHLQVRFVLSVLDVPGMMINPSHQPSEKDMAEFRDHLSLCDGVVFLHDPLNPDAFQNVQRMVNLLAAGQGGRLPHHLAVCVTKFDDPRVFDKALSSRMLERDPRTGLLLPPDPQAYFTQVAPRGVVRSINSYFHPERTAYFVTSSIGFRRDERGRFDKRDYANVRLQNGSAEVIGEIRPLNVLEPLVWLERKIRIQRRRDQRRH